MTFITTPPARFSDGVSVPSIHSPSFTKEYISAAQTITSAGLLTLAHGLGVAPKAIALIARCISAEGNWVANDEQFVSPGGNDQYSGTQPSGPAVYSDATNIYVRFNTAATTSMVGLNKTTGAYLALTNTKWNLIVKAWA